MAPSDIRPQGYFPQGSFIIPQGEKAIERRRRLAEELAKTGGSGPVQSWTQGAARLAGALGSVLEEGRANQMEQQRYKALGDAMRGGATPEQMMGTGDPLFMQIGKFKADRARQQFEDNRMNALLKMQQDAAVRAAGPPATASPGEGVLNRVSGQYEVPVPREAVPPVYTPYQAELEKQRAQGDQARNERVAAAQAFKAKVGRTMASIGQEQPTGQVDANGHPIMKFSGDDSLFGYVQSNPYYRGAANILNDVVPNSEGKRTALEAQYSDLELDVAKMKMTGQGQVSNIERQIAKQTLGGLSNPDAKTAWDILKQQSDEADAIIENGGEISGGAPPRQHPIQGAPPPQPNANAGEVPRPATAGSAQPSEFSFGKWEDIPEGRLVRDESDGKMYRKINGQMVPQ